MSTDASLIEAISVTARRALEPHTPDQPYALLDFPGHPNVGDSAIWAGAHQMLQIRCSKMSNSGRPGPGTASLS